MLNILQRICRNQRNEMKKNHEKESINHPDRGIRISKSTMSKLAFCDSIRRHTRRAFLYVMCDHPIPGFQSHIMSRDLKEIQRLIQSDAEIRADVHLIALYQGLSERMAANLLTWCNRAAMLQVGRDHGPSVERYV